MFSYYDLSFSSASFILWVNFILSSLFGRSSIKLVIFPEGVEPFPNHLFPELKSWKILVLTKWWSFLSHIVTFKISAAGKSVLLVQDQLLPGEPNHSASSAIISKNLDLVVDWQNNNFPLIFLLSIFWHHNYVDDVFVYIIVIIMIVVLATAELWQYLRIWEDKYLEKT